MSSSRLSRLLLLPIKPLPSSFVVHRAFSTSPLLSHPSRHADHRMLLPTPADPALKHVPIFETPKRDGHGEDNPDNIPAEGDQDHGRSGWGFQSRSRHEHFTFPGEPEYEFHPDKGWAEWVTPRRRNFFIFVLGIYFLFPYLPERHKLVVRRDGDYSFIRTDSLARQGPDDKRPLIIRLVEWARTEPADWRKTYWDNLEASIARADRNRAYFATLGMPVMNRSAPTMSFATPMTVNYYPGDIITGPVDHRTFQQDAEGLGLDIEFFSAQPPYLY